jgi:predicted NBD/HSP70 family sugar kinase
VAEREVKRERTVPAAVLTRAVDALTALLDRDPGRSPLSVGFAADGWVDRETGTDVGHPLPGRREVPVREVVGARTGLPVHGDGHAHVGQHGAAVRARGSRSVLHCSSAMWSTRRPRPRP